MWEVLLKTQIPNMGEATLRASWLSTCQEQHDVTSSLLNFEYF
jgi:hypothetical protein